MSQNNDLNAIATCLVLGAGLFYKAIKNQKKARQIEDTARSKLASAPQGLVELQGFAWPMNSTVKTSSDHDAVYYKFELQREEKRGSGKNRRTVWVTIFTFTHEEPFYILDPTGLGVVQPTGAEYDVASIKTTAWNKLEPDAKNIINNTILSEDIPNFPPSEGMFGMFNTKYRIQETEVVVGAPFYVLGHFETHSATSVPVKCNGLTNFANRVINLETKSFKDLKSLFDKDQDGKVTKQEESAGYTFAAKLALVKSQTEKTEENEFYVYGELSCSANHKLFFADRHEKHLVADIKKWQKLRFVGGAALMTIGILLMLKNVGLEKLYNRNVASVEQTDSKKVRSSKRKHKTVQPAVVNQTQSPADKQKEENARNLKVFHMLCTKGEAKACEYLIKEQLKFNLTEQYVKYYSQQGCKSGATALCNLPVSPTRQAASQAPGSN
ncbi:MAG: hypothetical protein V4736_13810 [Bdellovibrionota bacterium]